MRSQRDPDSPSRSLGPYGLMYTFTTHLRTALGTYMIGASLFFGHAFRKDAYTACSARYISPRAAAGVVAKTMGWCCVAMGQGVWLFYSVSESE